MENIAITSLIDAMESDSGFSVNMQELTAMMAPNYHKNMTEEEKARIDAQVSLTWKALNETDHFHYRKNKLRKVINKEVFRYYSGEITAKKAAESSKTEFPFILPNRDDPRQALSRVTYLPFLCISS